MLKELHSFLTKMIKVYWTHYGLTSLQSDKIMGIFKL